MNRALAFTFAAGAALLGGCAGQARDFDTNADPAAQAVSYVRSDKLDSLKGVRKVVLPYFQVEFVTKSNANVFSSSNGGSSSAGTSYTLNGVDDATMQDVTDRLYQRLLGELKQAGIEVVPQAEMMQLPAWSDVRAHQQASPYEVSPKGHTSRFFAPQGMGLYFLGDDKRLSLGSILGAGFSHMGDKPAEQFEPELQKQAGAGAVMQVRYTVDFASLKGRKSSLETSGTSQSSASVSSSVGMMLQPEATRFGFVVDGYPVLYMGERRMPGAQLKLPVNDGDNGWVRDVHEVNATANRVGEVAVAVVGALSMLSGGRGMSASTREYTVDADPVRWSAEVERMTMATDAMFLSQLRTAF